MKIVAVADLHGELSALNGMRGELKDADIVVEVGDLTNFTPIEEAGELLDRLLDFNRDILIVPGNCDQPEVIGLYESVGIDLHGRGKVIRDVGFFGVGGSNKTPFGTPIELDEHEISELLTRGYEAVKGTKVKVMVSHAPPLDTKADLLPNGAHVGSSAVREFIEGHEVDLVLCAHIHEARGSDRLGGTEIINVGPLNRGYVTVKINEETGKLRYAFSDLPSH